MSLNCPFLDKITPHYTELHLTLAILFDVKYVNGDNWSLDSDYSVINQ